MNHRKQQLIKQSADCNPSNGKIMYIPTQTLRFYLHRLRAMLWNRVLYDFLLSGIYKNRYIQYFVEHDQIHATIQLTTKNYWWYLFISKELHHTATDKKKVSRSQISGLSLCGMRSSQPYSFHKKDFKNIFKKYPVSWILYD